MRRFDEKCHDDNDDDDDDNDDDDDDDDDDYDDDVVVFVDRRGPDIIRQVVGQEPAAIELGLATFATGATKIRRLGRFRPSHRLRRNSPEDPSGNGKEGEIGGGRWVGEKKGGIEDIR